MSGIVVWGAEYFAGVSARFFDLLTQLKWDSPHDGRSSPDVQLLVDWGVETDQSLTGEVYVHELVKVKNELENSFEAHGWKDGLYYRQLFESWMGTVKFKSTNTR